MAERLPREIPTIVFTYMIFQGYADKNFLWYQLDGNSSRRTLGIPQFLAMVQDRWPDLVFAASEACRSTSFFLLDTTVPSITHLFPSSDGNAPYPDSIQQVFQDKKANRKTKTLIKEKTDLNDILNGYGFAPVNQQTTENFSVKIQKNDDVRTGFLNRFFNKR